MHSSRSVRDVGASVRRNLRLTESHSLGVRESQNDRDSRREMSGDPRPNSLTVPTERTTQCFTGNKKRGQITRFTAELCARDTHWMFPRALSKCRKLTVICFDLGFSIGKVGSAERAAVENTNSLSRSRDCQSRLQCWGAQKARFRARAGQLVGLFRRFPNRTRHHPRSKTMSVPGTPSQEVCSRPTSSVRVGCALASKARAAAVSAHRRSAGER